MVSHQQLARAPCVFCFSYLAAHFAMMSIINNSNVWVIGIPWLVHYYCIKASMMYDNQGNLCTEALRLLNMQTEIFWMCIFRPYASTYSYPYAHAYTWTHRNVQTHFPILSTPTQIHLVEQSDLVLPKPFSHPQCSTHTHTHSAHTRLPLTQPWCRLPMSTLPQKTC